ncbi:MAG: trypsin-like peptidase domain-containing protein, partial [Elusimicrobiota bacterium]
MKFRKLSPYLFLLLAVVSVFAVMNLIDGAVGVGSNKTSTLDESRLAPAVELQEIFVGVVEKVKPSVVNISTVQTIEAPQYEFFFGDPFEEFFERFFQQPNERPPQRKKRTFKYRTESGGSGFIIDSSGYIITNEHVIKDADEINVTVNTDGKEKVYKGKVVGKDERTDIAVVKINTHGIKLQPLNLGDSDKIKVGEWVLAIGSPFGLEQTVTNGIVSAIRQSVQVEGRVYRNFIQTDAAINRGNSGGPLCNIKGEVIGINTAIFAPTGVFAGIGFAIPVNRAKEILDELIHKGKVVRGWLGVEIKPMDDVLRRQFSVPGDFGVLINRVLSGSPAEKAGIERGDVIIEFDGKKVSSPVELQDIVSKTGPQKKVLTKIIRKAKELTLELVTGEMPKELTGIERGEPSPDADKG